MYWLFGSKSQLSTENKLLLYNAIQTYMGLVSDCGAAFNSNIEILQRILQRFQNKILRIIFDAP